MRPKKPNDAEAKRRKFRSRISKPGTVTAPKAPEMPKARKPQRKLDKWGRLEQRYAQMHAMVAPEVDRPSLVGDQAAEVSLFEATPAKAEPKATPPKANAKERNMPPRMARKVKSAGDQAEELKQCPTWVQKELARLNAIVAKLTGSKDKAKPKQLYFDEHWLAARWGMSIKHIRNLRSAGVGPKVTYFGRSVRYRLRDVVAFEKANALATYSELCAPHLTLASAKPALRAGRPIRSWSKNRRFFSQAMSVIGTIKSKVGCKVPIKKSEAW